MSIAFILAALALAGGFAAAMIAPLRRDPTGAGGTERAVASTLSARLGDIDRARAAGLLDDAAADEATLAAQRAALAAAGDAPGRPAAGWRAAAVAFAAVAPILVGAMYFQVGEPGYRAGAAPAATPGPASPGGIASLPPAERQAAIEGMVDALAARLEAEPTDAEGWRMLARSQAALGRLDAAIDSQRRLLALVEGDLGDWKNFAAALATSRPDVQFPADPEFLNALDEIEARAPGDPLVLFYRGGAALNAGDPATAVAIWNDLRASLPDDAPIRGVLDALIADAAADGTSATDGE
ncbi:MAG: c-type cytochrome biogenesis protein CcmI [Alphaproteobacteria bacterium]|nr:c-type cytochrome biogenesis protein CcmI [Alphaproteobacteria bacterium]